MIKILLCGAGCIGTAVARLLTAYPEYHIHLADIEFSSKNSQLLNEVGDRIKTVALDCRDVGSLTRYINEQSIQAVISCLPSELNPSLAQAARETDVHYFDLGDNVEMAESVQAIAQGAHSAFVQNCGLAPGIVGVMANDLMQSFEDCRSVRISVGALQENPVNTIDFSPACSVNRIISKYTNPCLIIENAQIKNVEPLTGLKEHTIKNKAFESFFAAAGLGNLIQLWNGKIQHLEYRSLHLPGHCHNMLFLLNELCIKDDIALLYRVLQNAIPAKADDQVWIDIEAEGIVNGYLQQKRYQKQLLPTVMHGVSLSASQASTAIGVCLIVDQVMMQPDEYKGIVYQESFALKTLVANRFGSYYV